MLCKLCIGQTTSCQELATLFTFVFLGSRGLRLMAFVTLMCWSVVQLLCLKKPKEKTVLIFFFLKL